MTTSVFPIGRGQDTRGFFARAWRLVHPYWHSEDRLHAWALLLTILVLSFGSVGMAVLYNHWHKDLYNALEARDAEAFGWQMALFAGIATLTILISAYNKYLKELLIVRWRRWLLEHYLDAWLEDSRHYRMQLERPVDNPDQRLTEDIEAFTRLTLGIVLGLVQTLTSLVSFSIILWTVSGGIELFGLYIPGYMFWAAVFYAGAGSLFTHLVGRRLIGLNNQQQKVEADLRFGLLRVRENGESIALQRGEADEGKGLRQRFGKVWDNFHGLVRTEKNLAFFLAGYAQFSFVFPLLVAAPRLFSGALQFGQLMQLNQAFGNLQSNLSWFIAVYHDLVKWRATSDRLLGFDQALAEVAQAPAGIRRTSVDEPRLSLPWLQTALPDGQPLLRIDRQRIEQGRHLLIQGPSGCGKSTLLRTLAGIWRYGKGEIQLPPALYVLPQRPYLPLGTLRQVLLYPSPVDPVTDDAIREALHACRLGHLADSLDEDAHWEKRLSPGEQQRLAVARALLARPHWLLLDEASSALDPEDEARLYRLLCERLPGVTLISIGHRPSLRQYHEVLWQILPDGALRSGRIDHEQGRD
ncbi:putative ATP-binding cassette transporter [Pseudomonas flavescens]|uniref:Putative ATP-binding cassette transporter n=1 Tax=Phytopseudomonas flavescens TaxID=29435 RepID=A0A1G8KU66_9GAMM|nr:ABC transporter ATP-binding protein/permease [Pseudomonas flavescens]SDI46978.1 putative ATP-binding cassette transporter [Pseudomonas flavescens]